MNLIQLSNDLEQHIRDKNKSKFNFIINNSNNLKLIYNNKEFNLNTERVVVPCEIHYNEIIIDKSYIYESIDKSVLMLKEYHGIKNDHWIGFFAVRIHHHSYKATLELKVFSHIVNIDELIRREDFTNKLENLLED